MIGTTTLEDRVTTALANAFAVEQSAIHPGLELRDELGADSLALVEVLLELETDLDVELPEDDAFVLGMTTVGDMVEALRQAGAE